MIRTILVNMSESYGNFLIKISKLSQIHIRFNKNIRLITITNIFRFTVVMLSLFKIIIMTFLKKYLFILLNNY